MNLLKSAEQIEAFGEKFLDLHYHLASCPSGNVEFSHTYKVLDDGSAQHAILTLKSYDIDIVQVCLYLGYGVISLVDTDYLKEHGISATTAHHISAFGREFLPSAPLLKWTKDMVNGEYDRILFVDPDVCKYLIAQTDAYESEVPTKFNALWDENLRSEWNTELDFTIDSWPMWLGTLSAEDVRNYLTYMKAKMLLEKFANDGDTEDENDKAEFYS